MLNLNSFLVLFFLSLFLNAQAFDVNNNQTLILKSGIYTIKDVELMEEFISNKEKEFDKVLKFLNLNNDNFNKKILHEKFNEGGLVKSKLIQSFFNNNNIIRDIYSLLPLNIRMRFRSLILNPLLLKNTKEFKYPKIDASTYQELIVHFSEDVQKLSKLTSKDYSKLWFNSSEK